MGGLTPYRKDYPAWYEHPFRSLLQDMDEFFRRGWLGETVGAPWGELLGSTFRADVRETDKAYVVEAELPGMGKDEIQIVLRDGFLTISAGRREETERKERGFIRRERKSSQAARSFAFDNVDQDKVSASYRDGVLTVTLPKISPGKKERTINIE